MGLITKQYQDRETIVLTKDAMGVAPIFAYLGHKGDIANSELRTRRTDPRARKKTSY